MLYPIIDIGSNTVKIAVLDGDNVFSPVPVYFKAVPISLRTKTVTNRLTPEAAEELCRTLKEFALAASRLTDAAPLAFATASLRGLENAPEILRKIREECRFSVELLSGEEEAVCSFLGAKGNRPVKNGISVDLGGGSTEILSFRGGRVTDWTSLPFGCLTLYNAYFTAEPFDRAGCVRLIREALENSAPTFPGAQILLSGGSAKAVLRYKNYLSKKTGNQLRAKDLERIESHYRFGKDAERAYMQNALKDRFRLVMPAVCVFREIARFYRKERFIVCRGGVREGYLFRYLQRAGEDQER